MFLIRDTNTGRWSVSSAAGLLSVKLANYQVWQTGRLLYQVGW